VEIQKISMSVGGTVNLGNYENAKFEILVEGIVGSEDSYDECLTRLRVGAHAALVAEVERLVRNSIRESSFENQTEAVIRRRADGLTAFDYLASIDKGAADALVGELVATYAVPEKQPVVPASQTLHPVSIPPNAVAAEDFENEPEEADDSF
jgi:hypothetical protein